MASSPNTAKDDDDLGIPPEFRRDPVTPASTEAAAEKPKEATQAPAEKPKEVETAKNTGRPALPDPFNAKALRLPPAFEHNAGVRKVLSTIPVRKPHGQEWIRVHPGEDFSDNFGLIVLKDDNEYYLLHPALVGAYESEMNFASASSRSCR